jgi:1,4-dihydroxy-6-naphthoate synthase
MELSLSFSPCPNDTFIFDALVNGKIDTEGLSFKIVMDDVEGLNHAALKGLPDISKISYAAWPRLSSQYALLSAGSALGRGVGPLLITADRQLKDLPEDLVVALPGELTTAHLLFTYAFPGHQLKQFMRYDQIQEFVLSGKGAGVIIHENRFTYPSLGLHLMMDLGSYWEKKTGHLIPLGGIVMKKSFPSALRLKVDELIRKSIEYNRKMYPALSEFIVCHAQEMDETVMRNHIDLYVNEYSENLGLEGESAIRNLTLIHDSIYGGNPENNSLY